MLETHICNLCGEVLHRHADNQKCPAPLSGQYYFVIVDEGLQEDDGPFSLEFADTNGPHVHLQAMQVLEQGVVMMKPSPTASAKWT